MATAPKILVPFSPAEVDALAQEYKDLEKKIADIHLKANDDMRLPGARLDELRELFLESVSRFGSAHAEKSKIIHGIGFEIMATFGSSSSIDNAAVEIFRIALTRAKLTRLLKKVFEKTIRWSLARNAAEVIRSTQLLPKLHLLFSQCIVVKDRTPTLIVRPKA